jgi:hypothetical protein
MEFWKTLLWCGCKSGYSPRRCACQKAENRSVLVFVPVAIAQNSPDQNTDENDFSDDDGLLFELDGFDGIFEEQ